jgi:hypothetical protein
MLENDGKDGAVTIIAKFNGAEQRIACGHNTWTMGKLAWSLLPAQPAAASGAWTGDETFKAKLCFYETPFIFTVSLKFSGDEVRFISESNASFGPTKQSPLVGSLSMK